jgi:hypothetical protein
MNPRCRQRGFSLLIIAIAMLSLLAIAGLALDMGHVAVNKARLQATADAAALSAAKVLDTTGSTSAATTAANSVFTLNKNNEPELSTGSISTTVTYSSTLPFAAGTTPAKYVKVTAAGFSIAATLANVVGYSNFNIGAEAIAGPSPTINNACNIAPMMLCGQASTPATPIYGYSQGEITALKLAAGGNGTNIGPGNYQLLRLGGPGAAIVEQNLAGGYAGCTTIGNSVQTEPGVAQGPTAHGLNTRFNEYQGNVSQAQDPPDVVTTQPSGNNRLSCQDGTCATIVTGPGGKTVIRTSGDYTTYSYEGTYSTNLSNGTWDVNSPPGIPERRVLAVPIGDCTAGGSGTTTVPVLGLACVFLIQDVNQGASNGQVFGEILQSCKVNGNPGPAPVTGPGPYRIQLYHVDGSPQS